MKIKALIVGSFPMAGLAALLTSGQVAATGPAAPALERMWLFDLPDGVLVALVAIGFSALAGLALLLARVLSRRRPTLRTTSVTLTASAAAGILVAFLAADTWHAYVADQMVSLPPTAAGRPIPDLLMAPTPAQAAASPRLPASALKALAGRARQVGVNLGALEDDTLTLKLFDDLELVAVRDRIAQVQGGQAWVGRIEGDPDSEVILAVKGNTLMGTVATDGRLFEIVFVNGDTHAVREIDLTQLPPEDPPQAPVTEGDATATTLTETAMGEASTGQVVDVMVVYSAKAQANAGGESGIQSRIINATTAANQAYLNSNIDMTLNLVHMGPSDYVETNSMPTALSRLRSTTDGYQDQVHPLREQYGADVVVLVSADTDYCGYGYVMRTVATSFATSAFAVVRDGCLTAGSFAHEIGHIMGNVHNQEDAGTAGAYPDSYGYRICGKFRDIMSYSCTGEPRVSYFSNPEVYYQTWPTGILGTNDTARSMNVTGTTVANFRPSAAGATTVPAAPGNLQASLVGTDGVALTWTDNATDEVGYRLQSSVDGATWFEIAALAANATGFTDTGLTPGQTYSYRVLAFNSIGNSDVSNLASATISLPVADTTQPVVKILTPANGAILKSNTTISLSATDNVAVTGLKLYIDAKLVGTTSNASLSYNWNIKKAAAGSHTIRGDALDSAGNLGSVTITVTKK